MKTQDLIGTQLDWAVAKAEGDLYPQGDVMVLEGKLFSIEPGDYECISALILPLASAEVATMLVTARYALISSELLFERL